MLKASKTVFLFLFLSISCPLVASYASDSPKGMSWLEGYSLVILDTEDVSSMHRARNTIQAFGGRVAILSPPSIIMGWVPPEVRNDLIGRDGIKDIYYTEVMPGEVPTGDEQTRIMINYFNAVVRGDIQREYRKRQEAAAAGKTKPIIMPDAFDPPPLEEEAYLENLRNVGLNPEVLKDRGLLMRKSGQMATGNSDRMTGTVSVTIFFVESDGSGSDPDLYTWTDQHMQDYVNAVNSGLTFWVSESYNYSDCWVAFMVHYYPGTDPRCQQWIEPILHSSSYQNNVVNNVITQFGYTSGSIFTKVNSFNTWQRSNYGTDWAYSGFVAYNPPPASDRFTNGYSAWAYFGGPYTYLLYRSFSWAPNQVFTHETGHIFYACDEYYQAGYGGCTSCGVCANGVNNTNCEYCGPGVPCMMLSNAFILCQYTPGHVGWFYSPCAPGPLNPPVAISSSPSWQYQGLDIVLEISGNDFQYGVTVDMGPDIVVNSSTFISADSFIADISVHNSATVGMRDVTVINPDLQSSVLNNAFEVRNTTRHYMSPTGGDVYPYITPANAATDLATAIATANDGDSVLVESTTLSSISINLNHGVNLLGGWINNFTGRDIVNGKTVLDLNGNVTISSGSSSAGLDGFIVENGQGSYSTVPFAAYFGGGIKIINSQVSITNCEIRSNIAASSLDFGVGGGIFAMNSTVDISGNYIWNNTADYGGGIYLYNCQGSMSSNTISGNQVASMTTIPVGAGIYVDSSADIVLVGNIIDSNTGAQDGGGIYIDHSGTLTISGGSISRNATTLFGGGIKALAANVALDSVEFSHNSALIGGAVALGDTSIASIGDCRFLGNSALMGGAVYASGGECHSNHNLLVENNASSSGGAVYVASLANGSIIGNTIDRNTAGSSAGGLFIVNSGIPVENNVITNTNDYGIYCGGLPSPTLKYNDVWNSGASNYYGCSGGEGSISADPLYVDTSAVDYHLGVHSPAIDSGDTLATYDDPDGSRGDMGWQGSHVFQMDQPSYPKNLSYSIGAGNVTLNWAKNPESDVQYYTVYKDVASNFTPGIGNFVQFVPAADTTFSEPLAGNVYYKISAVDSSGYGSGYSNEVNPIATGTGDSIVYKFKLYQNVPNPFNPATTIRYEVDKYSLVNLHIYDVQGKLVKRLFSGAQKAGLHSKSWDGRNEQGTSVSSGIYFYKLRAGTKVQTRKMVLLR